jgi:hypothetical protein
MNVSATLNATCWGNNNSQYRAWINLHECWTGNIEQQAFAYSGLWCNPEPWDPDVAKSAPPQKREERPLTPMEKRNEQPTPMERGTEERPRENVESRPLQRPEMLEKEQKNEQERLMRERER